METQQIYYEDAYATEADASVVSVEPRGGKNVVVELDRTIFYPEGGGQPSDQGEIRTETGAVKVQAVRNQDGRILHEGALTGEIKPGQAAHVSLKWNRRNKNMRVHSAGHLIHDVLMTMVSDVEAIKANHGDKAFLEYSGTIDPSLKDDLQERVNEAVRADIPIKTWDSNYDELVEICTVVPSNLPKHKQLRALRIGEFEAMPDGGVQVQSTREIGEVLIHHVSPEGGKTTIRYGVGHTLD